MSPITWICLAVFALGVLLKGRLKQTSKYDPPNTEVVTKTESDN